MLVRAPGSALQRGLTIVELLVTVALFALLAAVAIPEFATWSRNVQVRNAAEAIVGGLQKARAEAVRRNSVVYFSFVSLTDARTMDASCALSDTAGSWVISLESPATNCHGQLESTTNGTRDSTCTGVSGSGNWCKPYIIESHPLGDGGIAASVTSKAADNATAANQVLFNGMGRVWTTAGPFARPDSGTDGGAQCIDVSAAGSGGGARRLRIEVSDNGTVRMCDRDVTDTNDPRRCRACS